MAAVALWVLIAIFQSQGAVAGGWGSKESCEAARQEWLADDSLLAISPCTEVTVSQPGERS